ncbi:hypothetical protein [Ekhidna sp.]|uniref:hypothetical protein n=1 Tax=Ekhidna sp. TaxID=2608089 RepID=UPI0035197DB6
MRHYLKNSLVFILSLSVIGAFGQEYDDLYFTKKDRKKQKKKVEMTDPAYGTQYNDELPEYQPEEVEATSFLGKQFQENNPTSGVSQESLDYYAPEKTQDDYISENDQNTYLDNTNQNPNFSDPAVTFYDNPNNQPIIVNNYYNDNWNTWNRWNRPGWNFGFGWNNWGGNFWSISYGNAWGNPWYDPFWDPWWGWNSWGPAWGWNVGWGWNSWGWRNNFWCPPGYGYGRPIYVVDGNRYRGRDVVRGQRPSRGSVAARGNRSSSGRIAESSQGDRVSYSRQQAEYLNRSRSSRYSSGTTRGSSSVNSRSINSNTNSSPVIINNSGRTNSNYNRSSTPARSYSPPASSSGRSSSVRSSSPSRSSRSSGSVSRSSSSSRSSGSRSSSGRSSSGRRGGN